MDKYVYLEDLVIDRDDKSKPDEVVVYDCDGIVLDTFPKEWTDKQIRICYQKINKYYGKGVEIGSNRKVVEIKRALGIQFL